MRIGDRYDLTYCTNIHAGETWDAVYAALVSALPQIRRSLGVDAPFAIGLRLSAAAAHALEEDALTTFCDFLEQQNCYVPTMNGFPYGAFHGTRVKQRVYEPDWRDPRRIAYSNQLARILAALQPAGVRRRVSISTVPGAFRELARTSGDRNAIAAGILQHAAYLKRLHEETGVTITLAIEPEPACFIETVSEAVAFFREVLLSKEILAGQRYAEGSALTAADVARHVGVCLDACHMAVEFEDAVTSIRLVRDAGMEIAKVQLSSALRVSRTGDGAPPHELLAPFAEDTYLHQVVVAGGADLRRYTDLPEALQAHPTTELGEWRVHFHVPIFLASMSGFDTTQSFLAEMIQVLKREGVSTCLEVETYTWDVLPPEYRTLDMCEAIARELLWARHQLES
jgi:hypothetical protein